MPARVTVMAGVFLATAQAAALSLNQSAQLLSCAPPKRKYAGICGYIQTGTVDAIARADVACRHHPPRGASVSPGRCAAVSAPGAQLRRRSDVGSELGQDVLLDRLYFRGKMCGTFVELGMMSGLAASNTLRFEQLRAWRGLCLEPNPRLFKALARNRRLCTNLNVVVASERGSQSFTITSESGFDSLTRFLDHDKLRRAHVRVRKTVDVEAVPLRELLAQRGSAHVDLLSLDVEGAELSVLQSIDFGATSFGLLLVEGGHTRAAVVSLLERAGYQLHGVVGYDAVFANACLHPRRPSLAEWMRAVPWECILGPASAQNGSITAGSAMITPPQACRRRVR